MVEIIPTINVNSFEEIQKRAKMVEPYATPAYGGASWIQIDAADGTFTKNTIWHNAKDLLALKTSLKIEVHLMLADIDKRIDEWFLPNISRIIFHLEASKDPDFVIQKCRENSKEVGIAITPDTPWTKIKPYGDKVDLIQILGVVPGEAGQKMQEEKVIEKIIRLRQECPSCIIEVDGGVNEENVARLAKAGANILVSASAIFDAPDIGEAIGNLNQRITN